MQIQNNITEKEYHAVEYMREVRTELTEKFFQDKEQYLAYLKKTMADFKLRQTLASVKP